jgi:hypothetical protein
MADCHTRLVLRSYARILRRTNARSSNLCRELRIMKGHPEFCTYDVRGRLSVMVKYDSEFLREIGYYLPLPFRVGLQNGYGSFAGLNTCHSYEGHH